MLKRSSVFALALLIAAPAQAQVICCQLTNSRPQFRVHAAMPAACNSLVQNGAQLWNNSGANIILSYQGTYTTKVNGMIGSVGSHESGTMSGVVAADAAAYTDRRYTTFDSVRNRWNFDSFNVVYNENYTVSKFYCGAAGGIASTQLDLQDIATHEFGHGLGLDHDSWSTGVIMYPGNPWGISRRRLHTRDTDGAKILFPR